jgi:hypothetical protein
MTPAESRLPNFFIAGAPKAGTTSLYLYLGQHPQVYMSPIKEPRFFGLTDLLTGAGAGATLPLPVRTWEDYIDLFRNVRHETAIGEASVAYFCLPSAAQAIRAMLPDARLIFVLRDPAERLFTQYVGTRWRDPQITFRARFLSAMDPRDFWWSTVGIGRYATHLRRFLDAFPREQVRIHLYDDYKADPRALLRDIFAFLGVNPDYAIDLSHRHNETMVPRLPGLHSLRHRLFGEASVLPWLPAPARSVLRRLYRRRGADIAMDPADRRMVIEYYRDEILGTADLINRDLSRWLC